MDAFLWWSGVVAWGVFGAAGIILLLDWAIDWVTASFNLKKEFLAFAWDRMKRRKPPPIPGG